MTDAFAARQAEARETLRAVGARRVYREDLEMWVWQVPEYVCRYCGLGRGILPGCPDPLAWHRGSEQGEGQE